MLPGVVVQGHQLPAGWAEHARLISHQTLGKVQRRLQPTQAANVI